MKEAVHTMIYAASHLDIAEFENIRKQFELRWGKEFVKNASENKDLAVNQRVLFKLGVKVPEPYLCVQYMKEIARENNIKWEDTSFSQQEQPTGLELNQDYSGVNTTVPQSNQNQDLQQQILLLQKQLELQQQLNQSKLQQDFTQQKIHQPIVEEQFDPLTYVSDLKKKQTEKTNTPNVKSSGYQINFNPNSDPKQIPEFVTQDKNDIFTNQKDFLSPEELFEQQKQQKEVIDRVTSKEVDPFEELEKKLKNQNIKEEKSIDEFGGFDDGNDFDELQKRFEALKKKE